MNNGWALKKLGEICQIERGGSPRPIDEFLTSAPDGINWIKIGDTKKVRKYIESTEEKIKPEGAKRSRMVFDGDFLLSNSMSFGRPYIMKTTGCIHDGWLVLRPMEPKINQDYLFHVLGSDLVFQQFDKLAAGSTVRNLNIGLVKTVEIPLPPLPEQQRIVAILDEAFAAIATAHANAEKNLQNTRELFASIVESALEDRDGNRTPTTIGAEVELLAGFAFPSPNYTDTGVKLLRGDNIMQGRLRWEDAKWWPSSDVEPYRQYELRAGDLVLAMDRPWTKAGLKYAPISAADLPCLLVQRTARIRCLARLDRRFLIYLLGSQEFVKHVIGIQTGLGVPHISAQQIKAYSFVRPSLANQATTVDRLDALRAETQRLESIYRRKLAAVDELKQSLLHQAFNGDL